VRKVGREGVGKRGRKSEREKIRESDGRKRERRRERE
jgi:hypothetical protein